MPSAYAYAPRARSFLVMPFGMEAVTTGKCKNVTAKLGEKGALARQHHTDYSSFLPSPAVQVLLEDVLLRAVATAREQEL